MSFIAMIRPSMTIFYVLGQTMYPMDYYLCENKAKYSKLKRFSWMSPTIGVCVVKLVLCVTSVSVVDIYGDAISIPYDIMSDLFVCCEMVKALAVVYQNFVYHHLIEKILRNFQTVELLFARTLNASLPFASFKREYTRKVCWSIGSYVVLLTLYFTCHFLCEEIDLYDVFIKLMQFVSISVNLNILLFVDLLTFVLKQLNVIIARDHKYHDCDAENVEVFVVAKRNGQMAEARRRQLFKYKLIHFRLWKTTQQINQFYGWTLITILMQSFIEFVYDTIWQLQIIYDFWNFIKFSRK